MNDFSAELASGPVCRWAGSWGQPCPYRGLTSPKNLPNRPTTLPSGRPGPLPHRLPPHPPPQHTHRAAAFHRSPRTSSGRTAPERGGGRTRLLSRAEGDTLPPGFSQKTAERVGLGPVPRGLPSPFPGGGEAEPALRGPAPAASSFSQAVLRDGKGGRRATAGPASALVPAPVPVPVPVPAGREAAAAGGSLL